MTTHPTIGRYHARDAKHDRTALDRACGAACRRLGLGRVQLIFLAAPGHRPRWVAFGTGAEDIEFEGCGRSADEAVAAMTAVVR